jgi:uncharacterized protein (DUF1684 family)
VTDDRLQLLDWKRRVFALYAEVRAEPVGERAWRRWREVRDELFRTHPQSPLPPERRSGFAGLAYYDYDPRLRVEATVEPVEPVEPQPLELPGSAGSRIRFDRFGLARFELGGEPHALELYWLEAYGGGVFCPFADATSGVETYGAGRYLLDTVKGADLGGSGERVLLDFNFAYNPSCSYDPRWACPLAPPANRLAAAVRGGERHSSSSFSAAELMQ